MRQLLAIVLALICGGCTIRIQWQENDRRVIGDVAPGVPADLAPKGE